MDEEPELTHTTAPAGWDLLHPGGGQDHHRKVAGSLQYSQATQCSRIQTTSTEINHSNGPETHHALTFNPDHLTGADQLPLLKKLGSISKLRTFLCPRNTL